MFSVSCESCHYQLIEAIGAFMSNIPSMSETYDKASDRYTWTAERKVSLGEIIQAVNVYCVLAGLDYNLLTFQLH